MPDVPAMNSGGRKAPPGLPAGSRVAGYRIAGSLGAGGMATVYLAVDERLNRKVALKVLSAELAGDDAFRLRFIRESRIAASVDDPHIIPVFEAGESDGVLFIAMRYVRGGDVHSHVRESGPLPRGRAALILSQVASALDAAHRHHLVHRDVKPANMLMDVSPGGDRPDHIYLSDFGISKGAGSGSALTSTGLFIGTLDYMAPEQIEGEQVNGRADQYALACSAYELLSGAPPYTRDRPMAMIWAHVRDEPPALTSRRPDLPPQVDDVLGRALAKSPQDRYGTCRDFAAALREALRLPRYESGESAIPGVARTPTEAVPPAPVPTEAPAQPPAAVAAAAAAQAPVYAPLPPPTREPHPGYAQPPLPPYAQYPYLSPTGQAGQVPSGLTRTAPRPDRARARSLLAVAGALVVAAGIVAGSLVLRTGDSPPLKPGPTTPARVSGSRPPSSPSARPEPASFASFRRLEPLGASPGVSALAFSSTGSLATAGSNGTVYLWNPSTGKQLGTVNISHGVNALAFSPDGKTLAIGDAAGSVSLWNPSGPAQPIQLVPVSGSQVESIAFNPAGTTVAAGDASGDVRLWDVGSRKLAGEFAVPDATGVNTLAFSPDGTMLATGDYYGNAYLWQAATTTEIRSLPVPGSGVLTVAFSPNGSTLATASLNGSTYLWNTSTGEMTGPPLPDPDSNPGIPRHVEALAFSPDGTELATGDYNEYTYVWKLSDGSVIQELPTSDHVWAVSFSPNGRLLAAGDHEGPTYLWKG